MTSNVNRSWAAIVAAGAVTLGATACGDELGRSTPETADPTTTPIAAASATRVDRAVRALHTARRKVARGRPYDLESERYRGEQVWEIKVAKGQRRPHKLYVSADGRTIRRHTRARHRGDDAPKALKARVSLARALRTADKRTTGRLSEAEIDRTRQGTVVWTATFERSGDRETEVTIDAKSGKVTRIEHDDD